MRIIKVIFFSLLALSLIACTVVFIFFETFDTDQYLPQMANKASLALGRPVSIGGLGLGVSSRGITLDAGPLIIADDPDFTTQPFIKVDRVRISLDLKVLILQHKIHVTNILLQSPQVHFIRSEDGNINARSIGRKSQKNSVILKNSVIPKDSVILSAAKDLNRINSLRDSSGPKSVAHQNDEYDPRSDTIKSIKIQDASISFIDQSQGMPLDIWLRDINANLNDFSLSKPFQFSFHASPLVLKGISPGTPDSPIFKNIAGDLQLNMPHLDFAAFQDYEVNGHIIIEDGVIKNFNIINAVLSRTFGDFAGKIDDLLNGQFKTTLGTQDTVIKKAESKFSYHDKSLFIDDLSIQTNIFEFTAKGSLDQGLNMDMQTMLYLNEDVSDALVNEMEGLKYLMDDSKRISIDASLKGVIPHLKYKPNKDFRKKSKKMFMQEGGNILGVLLGGR